MQMIFFLKSRVTLLFFLITPIIHSQTQISNTETYLPVVPQAPSVSSFQKYQEIPVSKNSGLTQINVPIYTIPNDNVPVPLSLNYHAGGVRVNETAAWTGQNWNLIAGGRITRTVKHLSDDSNNGYINTSITTSMIYDACFLGNGNCVDYTNTRVRNNSLDFEADIFNYQAPGISGKFLFNQVRNSITPHGQIKSFPLTDNRIIPHFGSQNIKITGWTIYDTKGNRFEFVEGDKITHTNGVTTSDNFPQDYPVQPFSDSYTQTWNLSKIITFKGKEINFSYVTTPFSDCTFSGLSKVGMSIANQNEGTEKTTYIRTNGQRTYIDEITGDFGKVQFIPSTEYREDYLDGNFLKEIKVFNYNQKLIKNLSFDYFYTSTSFPNYPIVGCNDGPYGVLFNPNNSSTDDIYEPYTKRLFLDEITIHSSQLNNNNHSYIFEYYNENPLPHRNSYAQDFWGYYNGADNNNTLLFDFTKLYTNTPNRHVNEEYGKSGLLKSIVYPEGGITEFEYESNKATMNIGNAFGFRLVPSTKNLIQFNYQIDSFEKINSNKYRCTKLLLINSRTFYMQDELISGELLRKGKFIYNIDSSSSSVGLSGSIPQAGESYYEVSIEKTNLNADDYKDESEVNPNNINSTTQIGFNKFFSNFQKRSTDLPIGVYLVHFDIVNSTEQPVIEEFDFSSDNVIFNINLYRAKETLNNGIKEFDHVIFSNDYNQAEIPVGGQRIKKIKEYSAENKIAKVREYKYTKKDSEKTSGRILSFPYFISTGDGGINESSNTVVPLVTTSAGNINYTRVKEKFVGYPLNVVDDFSEINTYTYNELYTPIYGNPLVPFIEDWAYGAEKTSAVTSKYYSENFYDYNFVPIVNSDLTTYHYAAISPSSSVPYRFSLEESIRASEFVTSGGGITDKDFYKLQYGYLTLVKKTNTEYFDNNSNESLTKSINYKYANPNYKHFSSIETRTSDGDTIKEHFYYPHDLINSNEPFMNYFISSNNITELVKKQTSKLSVYNQNLINNNLRTIKNNFSSYGLKEKVNTSKGDNDMTTKFTYHDYDNNHNPIDVSRADGTRISYIWGYNGQYPVAKIENMPYSQLSTQLVNAIIAASNLDDDRTIGYIGKEGELRQELSTLRNQYPGALVTTFTYDPLIGATSTTDPKGDTAYYEYDGFNRLKYVKDQDGNILSENEYRYKTTN